ADNFFNLFSVAVIKRCVCAALEGVAVASSAESWPMIVVAGVALGTVVGVSVGSLSALALDVMRRWRILAAGFGGGGVSTGGGTTAAGVAPARITDSEVSGGKVGAGVMGGACACGGGTARSTL